MMKTTTTKPLAASEEETALFAASSIRAALRRYTEAVNLHDREAALAAAREIRDLAKMVEKGLE